MTKREDFEKKLDLILEKYKTAIESKDGGFVSEYMRECLDREVVLSPRSFKTGKRSKWQLLSNFLIKLFIIFLFLSGLLLYTKEKLEHGESDEYAKDANYWTYVMRRWVVRLGLNQFVSIQKLYEADCLINNPLVPKEPRPCFCGFTLKRYRLNSTDAARKAFQNKLKSGNLHPFIMQNILEYPVSYVDLKNVVTSAEKDFDSGNSFTTALSGRGVSSDYKQLFSDPENPPSDSHVAWDLNYVAVAHHLRTLFARPFFVSPQQEIHLWRRILLHGANAPSAPVKVSEEKPGSFYIQAWGSRVMALKSPPACKCKSSVLAFSLNQGDLLYFSGDHHDLYSAPTKTHTGYSIGYIGHIGTDVAKGA